MPEPAPGGLRVLVVDDEQHIRNVISRMIPIRLRALSAVATTASNVDEALAHLESHPVDLVLTDYRMPGRTGAELLSIVKERWPHTARIMMSGYSDIMTETGPEVEAIVEGFITKPWDIEGFFEIIHSVLESRAGA